MRKWIGFATLLAGLAVLTVPAMPPADAQDKKEAKKDGKKGEAKKEAIGTIEIYKAKDGFRFRIGANLCFWFGKHFLANLTGKLHSRCTASHQQKLRHHALLVKFFLRLPHCLTKRLNPALTP